MATSDYCKHQNVYKPRIINYSQKKRQLNYGSIQSIQGPVLKAVSFVCSKKILSLDSIPPNAGKSTLANRICKDWLGEEMSTVSAIPHETREVIVKEKIEVKSKGKSLSFNLVDTPGIATKIDYEDFLKFKMNKDVAKERAKEATKGVIDAIKWLDDMDAVVVVLDSTINPYSQVNITIIGNLAARDIPVMIAANKTDLKKQTSAR